MKKKILIFIITYKAKHRVVDVFKKIPFKKLRKFNCNVLISDDASKDETVSFINQIQGKKIFKNNNNVNLGYGGNTALTVFGQLMKNIYEDETITDITQKDVFKYSNTRIKNIVQNKMNCNQMDFLNPEQNIEDEEF